MKALCLCAIRIYQIFISPLFFSLGARCRYEPSCSHYAIEVLKRDSLGAALKKILYRVLSCQPWNGAGYDASK